MSDWALMAVISIFVVLVTLGVSTAYYSARVDEVRRDCIRRLAHANAELMAVQDMLKKTEMQRRVLGSVPIAKYLREDTE